MTSRVRMFLFDRPFAGCPRLPPLARNLHFAHSVGAPRALAGSALERLRPMSKERPDSKDAGGSSGHSLCARHAPAQQHQLAGRSPRNSYRLRAAPCGSANHFQGGPSVDVFGANGSNPTANWKVSGTVQKVYDKALKSHVFVCDGGPTALTITLTLTLAPRARTPWHGLW